MAAMTALALRLTRLIGLALGLPDGFFDRPGMFDKPSVFLRPLHYNGEFLTSAQERRPLLSSFALDAASSGYHRGVLTSRLFSSNLCNEVERFPSTGKLVSLKSGSRTESSETFASEPIVQGEKGEQAKAEISSVFLSQLSLLIILLTSHNAQCFLLRNAMFVSKLLP